MDVLQGDEELHCFTTTESVSDNTHDTKKSCNKRKQSKITDQFPVSKRKFDRFNGMPEEEVLKRGLPDHLKEGLDIVFVGINPGLAAAYTGHYYTGPGNHFWSCLYLSGFVETKMNSNDDVKMMDYGIGFTNMVARTTKGSNDLSKAEIAEGGKILTEKLKLFKPKIVVFNGKISYEIYSKQKKFQFGLQKKMVEDTKTRIWVMPSSSARCAQLPRAVDKVPFFEALRRYRDYLNGEFLEGTIDESEFVFSDLKLKGFPRKKTVE
ncbi:G/T mismatch-specific thymine DNA glycosylase-like [Hydractinia symbiolongicarpus]|uniref:G/T mismatch-specific thymine DNA glycosylase-like n=1 Tax=Hydractinia symbiolongicarpus TaxID=13093 RepID=UPI002550C2D6|nr:G/T mismatch-specific thymine DNA glycosylase-like [Hydractinia symbiolongicarpus]